MEFTEQQLAEFELAYLQFHTGVRQRSACVTIADLAARLGVSIRSVRQLHAKGQPEIPRISHQRKRMYLPEVADEIAARWRRGER